MICASSQMTPDRSDCDAGRGRRCAGILAVPEGIKVVIRNSAENDNPLWGWVDRGINAQRDSGRAGFVPRDGVARWALPDVPHPRFVYPDVESTSFRPDHGCRVGPNFHHRRGHCGEPTVGGDKRGGLPQSVQE